MMQTLGLIAASAVFVWGVWDYFHSEHPSSSAFIRALVGVATIVVIIVRALV